MTTQHHEPLAILVIDGCEVPACEACSMALAFGEHTDAPNHPECAICSTVPPSSEEAESMSKYEAMIASMGPFKASLGHIANHMNGRV